MRFIEVVAIRLRDASPATLEHKALLSFAKAVRGFDAAPLTELLGIWIAAMIDNGISVATRKRYVEKLSVIYAESGCIDDDASPFDAIRPLRDYGLAESHSDIISQSAALSRIFNTLLKDAETRPEIALFLYLLFNASTDVKAAILLSTDQYSSRYAQLDGIIDTANLHHRRKYVFDLGQSRKREPQLIREALKDMATYFGAKGLKFGNSLTPTTITALWVAKAREAGIPLRDIAAVIDSIPEQYGYLKYVKGNTLDEDRKLAIKRIVASQFAPVQDRWYAMKLRRGVSYDDVKSALEDALPDRHRMLTYFYPTREIVKKVDKKIVKEQVPYIADIVFLRTKQRSIADIDKTVRHQSLGWIFRQTSAPESDYSVIDRRSMELFQRAVGSFSRNTRVDFVHKPALGVGQAVRITGGMLEGYIGQVYDIKNDGDDTSRHIFIRLCHEYGINVELKIDEFLVEPLPHA